MRLSVPSITSNALLGDPNVIHLITFPSTSIAGLDDMTTAFPDGRISFVGTSTSSAGRKSALGSPFLTKVMSKGSTMSHQGIWKRGSASTAALNSHTPFSQTFSSANSFFWPVFFLNWLQDLILRIISRKPSTIK